MKKLICLLVISLNCFAESSEGQHWYGSLGYSYFDTWIPGKIAGTVGRKNEFKSYEFTYQQASYNFDVIVDGLGKITDQRLILATRNYIWDGTFNLNYGLYYNSFSARLGNTITDVLDSSYDVIKVETIGLLFGFGNTYYFTEKISMNVDWLRIFYPISQLNDESDDISDLPNTDEKDDIKKVVDVVSSLPTFSAFYLEFTYHFF